MWLPSPLSALEHRLGAVVKVSYSHTRQCASRESLKTRERESSADVVSWLAVVFVRIGNVPKHDADGNLEACRGGRLDDLDTISEAL